MKRNIVLAGGLSVALGPTIAAIGLPVAATALVGVGKGMGAIITMVPGWQRPGQLQHALGLAALVGGAAACSAGGLYVSFDPLFRATPAVAANGQELPTGARSVRSSVTRSGFISRSSIQRGRYCLRFC